MRADKPVSVTIRISVCKSIRSSVPRINECTSLRVFASCSGFAREAALVYLQVHSRDQADVRWDPISGRKRDNVSWNKLVGEQMKWLSIAGKGCKETYTRHRNSNVPNKMTVVRDELVKCLQTLLRPLLLDEADCRQGYFGSAPCIQGCNSPVRTIRTATVMLTASSIFPMTALTIALPHRSRIRGFS